MPGHDCMIPGFRAPKAMRKKLNQVASKKYITCAGIMRQALDQYFLKYDLDEKKKRSKR